MKKTKKIIIVAVVAVIVAVVMISLFAPGLINKIGSSNTITTAGLEDAIDINELSTAEFVYNGIAEKHKDNDPDKKVECYIAYDVNVKIGIQMDDVQFDIDEKNKTVKPVLPDISVNVAALDEESISYIPENPDLTLKEVINLCKEDAMNEANNSEKLYQTAEENLKAVIEALLSPMIDNSGYSIVW